eukprot:GHVP01025672.1.p1 GENE.GHVP01025672.1~~GHVP01025672.1.p1  ORF type:complete len:400 (-),score=18.33 GHVP01025672.1:452-1651(-)
MLASPFLDAPFVLLTDASDGSLGAALAQIQAKNLVLIEFASKKLLPPQRKWPAHEKDLYAIRWAVGHFHDYLWATRTLVLTDNSAATYLQNAKNGKLARWTMVLNWLSRCVDDEDEHAEEDWARLSYSYYAFYAGEDSTDRTELTSYEERDTFLHKDKLRYHHRTQRLFIPKKFRKAIIYWWHMGPYGAHHGARRTSKSLKRHLWWPNLDQEVLAFTNACPICVRHRPIPTRTLLGTLTKPGLFELISVDGIGPIEWEGNAQYIYCIVDHATRFLVAETTNCHITAQFAVSSLNQRFVRYFGASEAVLCDRGSEFRAKEFTEFVRGTLGAVLVFPGFQPLAVHPDEQHRAITIRAGRIHSVLQHLTKTHHFDDDGDHNFQKGDLIVFPFCAPTKAIIHT